MSPILQQALGAAFLPFACGLVVALLARGQVEGATRRRSAFAAPAALAVAYLVTHVWTQGVPAFPYVGVTQGLAYLAVAALGAGLLAARWKVAGLALATAVGAAGVWVLFAFHREAHWEGASAYLWTGALATFAPALVLVAGDAPARRPRTFGVVLVGVVGLLAAALGASGSASLALLAGGLAAGLAGLVAASFVRGPVVLAPGGLVVLGLSAGALVLAGAWVGELAPLAALLAGAAPFAAALWARATSAEASMRTVLSGALVPLGLAAGALAVALSAAPPPDPYGY